MKTHREDDTTYYRRHADENMRKALEAAQKAQAALDAGADPDTLWRLADEAAMYWNETSACFEQWREAELADDV